MDLNDMGHRKRQDLLSKLGAWGPWERMVGGEGRGRKGRGKSLNLNINNKRQRWIKYLPKKENSPDLH